MNPPCDHSMDTNDDLDRVPTLKQSENDVVEGGWTRRMLSLPSDSKVPSDL